MLFITVMIIDIIIIHSRRASLDPPKCSDAAYITTVDMVTAIKGRMRTIFFL